MNSTAFASPLPLRPSLSTTNTLISPPAHCPTTRTTVFSTATRRRQSLSRLQAVAAPPPPLSSSTSHSPPPAPHSPRPAPSPAHRTDPPLGTVSLVPIAGHAEFLAAMAASQETLVVVKFYAGWCRACKAVGLKMEKIAKEYPNCLFYECSFEDNSDLCRNLGIKKLPTIQFYKGDAGKIEDFQVGPSRVHIVRQKLNTYGEKCCDIADKDHAHFKI